METKNKIITQGTSPLGIRIVGTGKYVREQLLHVQDFMDFIVADQLEDNKQSYE